MHEEYVQGYPSGGRWAESTREPSCMWLTRIEERKAEFRKCTYAGRPFGEVELCEEDGVNGSDGGRTVDIIDENADFA